MTVTVNQLPATPVVTAPSTVGAGAPNQVASVAPVSGAAYAWSIANGTITGGQGTSQITFTAGTAGAPVTLGATVTVGSCSSAAGTASVVVTPVGAGGKLYTVALCRLVDTREAAGPRGGPALEASGTPDRLFPITGACGIPAGAAAVSANVTVVDPSAPGYLAIYRGDGPYTGTSSVSFGKGTTRANNVVLPISHDGVGTARFHNSSGGPVHLVVDVNGYFE